MKKVKVVLASALVAASVLAIDNISAYADNSDIKQEKTVISDCTDLNEENLGVKIEGEGSNKVLLNITPKKDTGEEWGSDAYDTSIMNIEKVGDTTWSITGLSEGTEVIEFYEKCPGGESITYIINVDSDLNVTLTEKDPNAPIEKKQPSLNVTDEGKKLSVNLNAVTTSGCTWRYTINDNSVAEIEKEGNTLFGIKGLKEGTAEVTFEEITPGGKLITYIINVDSDLNITFKEKEKTLVNIKNDVEPGSEWVRCRYDDSIIRVDDEDDMVWSIVGLKEGTTELKFRENAPFGKIITYTVNVDSNLNVTVEKEKKTLIKVDIDGLEPAHLVYNVNNRSIVDVKREYDNVWSIRGLKEGTTYVDFHEDRPSAKSVTYVIKVDSDLNVTCEKRQPTYKEKNDSAISFKGNKISINSGKDSLKHWRYEFEDSSIAKIQNENSEWSVIGLKEGTTKVRLYYNSPGKEYFTYIIDVDSDLNVTIKEPKKALIKIDTNGKDELKWYMGSYDNSVVYIQKEDDNLWSVLGLKEGNIEVTFNDPKERRTITYAIKIESDLNVTFEEKGRGTIPKNEEVISPSSVKLQENTILIDENFTENVTGYHWEYEIKDDSVAEIQKENIYKWNVIGLKEGTTEILVDNNCPGGESATYVINVDSNLNVTLEEKKKESDSKTEDVSSEVKVDEKKSDVEIKENEPKFDFTDKEENSKPVEIIDEGSFEVIDNTSDSDFTLGEDKMDDNIVICGPDEEEPGSIISSNSVSDVKDEETEAEEVTVEE